MFALENIAMGGNEIEQMHTVHHTDIQSTSESIDRSIFMLIPVVCTSIFHTLV